MPFTEAQKLEAKKRALYKCCICQEPGTDVHHITPESQGGPNDIDNAALLCAKCHDLYGDTPKKRKFVRENRDLWYQHCQERYFLEAERLNRLEEDVKLIAEKIDSFTDVPRGFGLAAESLPFAKAEQSQPETPPGTVSSFADVIRHIVLGLGEQADNPFMQLATLFDAETLEDPSWAVSCEAPVKTLAFRSRDTAMRAWQNVIVAYQKAQHSGLKSCTFGAE